MNPVETFNAAFDALRKWRDEVAPGMSVNVTLEKWQYRADEPHETRTTLLLYCGDGFGPVARTEMTDDNIAAALVRLTESKAKNAEKRAIEKAAREAEVEVALAEGDSGHE